LIVGYRFLTQKPLLLVLNVTEENAARPGDDVLLFAIMAMAGRALAVLHDHNLLGVGLASGCRLSGDPVAKGEQDEPHSVEIALVEVRDVPAETAAPDGIEIGRAHV